MNIVDFTSLDYLLNGNSIQKTIYYELKRSEIFEKLSSYDPILVGTYPIDIPIKSSDLDIILYANDLDKLNKDLNTFFYDFPFYRTEIISQEDNTYLNCTFKLNSFTVELYAENTPTEKQYGYLHMVKEHEILVYFGKVFREEVIKLKKDGYKTEPAFAKLLGLNGNPYEALLQYQIKKQGY